MAVLDRFALSGIALVVYVTLVHISTTDVNQTVSDYGIVTHCFSDELQLRWRIDTHHIDTAW